MAHAFDAGAVLSGRTLLRNAIVAQLEQLTVAEGLYLSAVIPLPATINEGSLDHVVQDIVAGKSPVVMVALGDGRFAAGGAGFSDEWTEAIDVEVYCLSSISAGTVLRMTGDASSALALTKDPGIEICAEHVRERLAGWRPSGTGLLAKELRIQSLEPDFYFGPDHTIARLSFVVEARADVDRLRGFTQLLEGVDATHGEDDADPGVVRPTLETETDIT